MPLVSSPVTPPSTSRLWAAGGPIVAVAVLVVLAALHPELALELLVGAGAVAVVAWLTLKAPIAVADQAEVGPTQASTPAPISPAMRAPSSTLLGDAFDALQDPLLLIVGGEIDDLSSRRIVLANRAALETLRVRREGGALISSVRDPQLLEAVDEALFGGVSTVTDFQLGDSQPRHWRAWARPLPAVNGAPAALLGLTDQTDVRRMEMMRVDFLANASHELRTPLASLSGFIETLKGHAREDPVARDRFLDIMSQQAERMSRLVADLLSLSRIELNEHIAPAGRVDLPRAAADVIDALTLIAGEKQVALWLGERSAHATIRGDRDEILQVIQNLVDNALKYSPAGATVEIDFAGAGGRDAVTMPRMPEGTRLTLLTPDGAHDGSFVSVTVRDHGPGIARENLPRLTERFYRVEGQKSGQRPGTGLGLAIVKHIANRHRGGLIVESAPGQGTAFTAYFPAAAAKSEPSPAV